MVLLQGQIHGDAPAALLTRANDIVQQISQHNQAVQAMLTRDDIVLLILVQPGEGDQETRVKCTGNNRTGITITLFIEDGSGDEVLTEALLHELVLHGEPATNKHLAAVANNQTPEYPDSDDGDAIEAEEQEEHEDESAWYRVADIALQFDNQTFEKAIFDASSHDKDIAVKVLNDLVQANRITQEHAEELEEVMSED